MSSMETAVAHALYDSARVLHLHTVCTSAVCSSAESAFSVQAHNPPYSVCKCSDHNAIQYGTGAINTDTVLAHTDSAFLALTARYGTRMDITDSALSFKFRITFHAAHGMPSMKPSHAGFLHD